MKILFLVPYPVGRAPSQRFRFEQYLDLLEDNDMDYHVSSFLDDFAWNALYQKGSYVSKILGITIGFIRRLFDVIRSIQYDIVFIHREAAPLGPPVFEWLIACILRKKIIYDFDDAIWLPNVSSSNKRFSKLKWYQKVSSICRWSWKISCGNANLVRYAKRFNDNVMLNPTTIDAINVHNRLKNQATERVVIGWTGTHSTTKYLKDIVPVIADLEEECDFDFYVISDIPPSFSMKSMKFVKWRKQTEIEDLLKFNIGIMPMPSNDWSNGKCGFKTLQYMALGIPAVASDLEISKKIIDEGINGFICSTDQQWRSKLALLINDEAKRVEMGSKAVVKVRDHFSVASNSDNFLSLFK